MYHQLLKRFPAFAKPSYETIVHKKVLDEYDLCVAVPHGKRSYLWFTHYNGKKVCCIVEIGRDQKLQDNIHFIDIEIPPQFESGTVLCGYLFDGPEDMADHKYFVADDIFMFKGYEFGNPFPMALQQKMRVFIDFFQQLTQNQNGYYSIHSIIYWYHHDKKSHGIPDQWKERIQYPVRHIQYRCSTQIIPHMNLFATRNVWNMAPNLPIEDEEPSYKPKTTSVWSKQITHMPQWNLNLQNPIYKGKRLFWIQADLAYDVYHMYANNRELYQYAFIPDQKTSKMMNAMFRNIPENDCLDRIEESDDEEDFENVKEDKYLRSTEPILIECRFHFKFKKWIPISQKPIHLAKFVPTIGDLVVVNNSKPSSMKRPPNYRGPMNRKR